jgi:hypothetical protein
MWLNIYKPSQNIFAHPFLNNFDYLYKYRFVKQIEQHKE